MALVGKGLPHIQQVDWSAVPLVANQNYKPMAIFMIIYQMWSSPSSHWKAHLCVLGCSIGMFWDNPNFWTLNEQKSGFEQMIGFQIRKSLRNSAQEMWRHGWILQSGDNCICSSSMALWWIICSSDLQMMLFRCCGRCKNWLKLMVLRMYQNQFTKI